MLKVLGVEAGIGSMLCAAREVGFEVIGNIESRNQFYSGTFGQNFDNAFMRTDIDKQYLETEIDLIVSQPKCGNFSSMSWANPSGGKDMTKSKSQFPRVCHYINLIKPKFFLIDNLPKSLLGSPLLWWAEQLPEYRLDLELVSNYNYGNIQLRRNRLFIFGWRKDQPEFKFTPGEFSHTVTTKDIIENVSGFNHDIYPDNRMAPNLSPMTIAKAKLFLKDYPEGRNPDYFRDFSDEIQYVPFDKLKNYSDEDLKKRIGTKKVRWNSHCQTITSGNNLYHPIRCDPLTCRERAKIMGFPDDFKFVFNSDNERFGKIMGCQTGQAVPLQFVKFMTRQVKHWLENYLFVATGVRNISSELTEKCKQEYCREHGNGNCQNCVIKKECYLNKL